MNPRTTIRATGVVLGAAALVAVVVLAGAHSGGPDEDRVLPARQGPCLLDAIAWSDPERYSLPGRLREVSGLAVLQGTQVLAHDDERAVVTLLDAGSGEATGQFSLGPRLPRGDFEGIAVLGNRLYLSTSGGRVFEAPLGTDGQTVAYRIHETGLGELCEVEGLAADPASRALLLSCKTARARTLRDQVVVYAWSIDRAELDGAVFRAPESAVAVEGRDSFRPSAVETLPGGGLLLLSGADRAIAVVAPPDTVRCTRRLDSRHRQAEGLTLLADGSLVIADEGNPARLTIYHPERR